MYSGASWKAKKIPYTDRAVIVFGAEFATGAEDPGMSWVDLLDSN